MISSIFIANISAKKMETKVLLRGMGSLSIVQDFLIEDFFSVSGDGLGVLYLYPNYRYNYNYSCDRYFDNCHS